jgi:hypothetical protein
MAGAACTESKDDRPPLQLVDLDPAPRASGLPNLLLVADDPADQCSFYRLWPFLQFRRELQCRTLPTHRVGAHNILDADVVVFLRPWFDTHLELIATARRLGRSVWIDYDDDFLCLDRHHHFAERFGSIGARKRFSNIAALAHVVSVSTLGVAASLDGICTAPPVVIPNAFNDSLQAFPFLPNEDSSVIFWRGSYSHVYDFELVKPALQSEWARKSSKVVLNGSMPWELPGEMPHATTIEFLPMWKYFQTLQALRPAVVVVPLENTASNRAKSNCAWIEATHAGACVLASPLPEFERLEEALCLGCSSSVEMWEPDLRGLLGNLSELRKTYWQKSVAYIREHLLLSKVNEIRRNILAGF